MFDSFEENLTAASDLSVEISLIKKEFDTVSEKSLLLLKSYEYDNDRTRKQIKDFSVDFSTHTSDLLSDIDVAVDLVEQFGEKSGQVLAEEPETEQIGEDLSERDEEDLKTLKDFGFESVKLEDDESDIFNKVLEEYEIWHSNFRDWVSKFKFFVKEDLNYNHIKEPVVERFDIILNYVKELSEVMKNTNTVIEDFAGALE